MRCGNDVLMDKISNNKLDNTTEVTFRVRTDLPDCRKIDTKNYTAITVDGSYNRFAKPVNQFECGRKGCITTGTLTMSAADGAVTYRALYDATEFAAGVVTFYVKPDAAAEYPVSVTLKVSNTDTFTDADVYTVSLTQDMLTDDGFIPVLIDLSKTPTSTAGNGWEATSAGAYLQMSSPAIVGYSSISIFDSVDDFEIDDVVKVGCLTSIGGTFDFEMITAACQDAQYNPDIKSLTYPLTGTMVTPNYAKLNPMIGKGKNVVGFNNVTVEKTIEASGDYGKITLPDANADVCGYVAVQISDSCDVTDAVLTRLSVPVVTDVDEGHYLVIKEGGGIALYFNKSFVGTTVKVAYPQTADIEEQVMSPDNLGGVHVSMSVAIEQSDGVKYVWVFDNVFVTSFPATITTEDTTFAFTITIARDSDGNFARIQRIIG